MIAIAHPFQSRRDEEELMDLPTTSRAEFLRALDDIQWVNRNLGGTQALLDALIGMFPERYQGTLSVLDLGAGSADIPLALCRWARQAGQPLRVTAVDLHPVAVEAARTLTQDYPEITVRQGDALNVDEPDESYDFVVSSMFMHHLSHADAVRLLREMARLCRTGFVINDLQRHPLAWLGIKSLGVLTGKGRIFRNDAPLSVWRGFTRPELMQLKQDAGLPTLEIHHRRPYRWILRWRRAEWHAANEASHAGH